MSDNRYGGYRRFPQNRTLPIRRCAATEPQRQVDVITYRKMSSELRRRNSDCAGTRRDSITRLSIESWESTQKFLSISKTREEGVVSEHREITQLSPLWMLLDVRRQRAVTMVLCVPDTQRDTNYCATSHVRITFWNCQIVSFRNMILIYRTWAVLVTTKKTKTKRRGLSPRAKFSDRVTSACRWT
jgi:hypothetical protein